MHLSHQTLLLCSYPVKQRIIPLTKDQLPDARSSSTSSSLSSSANELKNVDKDTPITTSSRSMPIVVGIDSIDKTLMAVETTSTTNKNKKQEGDDVNETDKCSPLPRSSSFQVYHMKKRGIRHSRIKSTESEGFCISVLYGHSRTGPMDVDRCMSCDINAPIAAGLRIWSNEKGGYIDSEVYTAEDEDRLVSKSAMLHEGKCAR